MDRKDYFVGEYPNTKQNSAGISKPIYRTSSGSEHRTATRPH